MQPLPSSERFSSRVSDYVRYRPGYPAQLMEWLRADLGVAAGTHVADIGAGTGISSQMLLAAGYPVTAVEPNAAMRAAAQQWLGAEPGFQIVDGNAEATGLASASVGLIAAAQAFHWFNVDAARQEWQRILRPDGLALIFWNSRELDSSPFMVGYEQVLLDFGTDYRMVAERYQDDATMHAWFGTGLRGARYFANVQRLDWDGLRGRLMSSSSYAPQEGDPRHLPMLAALERLFRAHAVDGYIDFEYQTRAFAGTLS